MRMQSAVHTPKKQHLKKFARVSGSERIESPEIRAGKLTTPVTFNQKVPKTYIVACAPSPKLGTCFPGSALQGWRVELGGQRAQSTAGFYVV